MKIRLTLSILVGLLLMLGSASATDYVPGEVLVKFRAGMQDAGVAASLGATVAEELQQIGVSRFQLPAGLSVEAAVAAFSRSPAVEFAEPNYIAYAVFIPNDTYWGSQWGPAKIQCPAGWDINTGSSAIKIAIVDTGIDMGHADLNDKIRPGYDFVNNDSNADDDNGHGTHCAGIAAAETNNALGVAGVGFNCSLVPVKVLNSSGSGSYTTVANGINWAADNGAHVISLSLGGTSSSGTLESAVNYAWGKGVVIVAAAGNNGNTTPFYPAYYANCIAVASTDSNDNRSSFSNYGSWVEVAAPGSSIYSTYDGNSYTTLSGTSMAAPHVAGLAGLLWSYLGTGAGNSTIRSRIESNTDYVGTFVTFGRINVYEALTGGGGGGDEITTDYAPTSYTVLQGSTYSGSLSNILTSDNTRLEIASTSSGFTRYVSWYAATNVSISGTLKSLKVTLEANFTSSRTVYVYLYNFTTGAWDQIGSASLGTGDSTKVFTRSTGPTSYVSGTGEVRARFYASRTWWSSFRMRTDLVKISTVTIE
ncbi:MAG: S8 family peptidase [Planctomycetota bacterium]